MQEDKSTNPHIITAAAGIFIAFFTVYFLVVADTLLIPLVLAVLLWYVIHTIDHVLSGIKVKGWTPPGWLRFFLALAILAAVLNLAAGIVAANISRIIDAAPRYQANLERLLRDLPFGIELEEIPALSRLTRELNIGLLMQEIARSFAGILGSAGLIVVYLFFLFLESRHFGEKLAASCRNPGSRKKITNIIFQIDHDIKRYIGVKTSLSLVTAAGSWVIMRLVGLDFAGFWAVLIFLLNFIPNLGSIIATALPSLMALLQFETLTPFFIILPGVGALQIVIGNFLDPALMGKSLNVSPLVIIVSLVLWGAIWGLPGMFLCVPITVMLMIILYNFDRTRWIAVLLSKDGKIENENSDLVT